MSLSAGSLHSWNDLQAGDFLAGESEDVAEIDGDAAK
jgi:hypothetical protein